MVARFSSGEEGPFWAGPGWHCPPCSWLLVVVGDPRGPKLPLVNVQLGSFSLLMGNV